MDVPDEDTTAAKLSSSKSSVGCTGFQAAAESQPVAENASGGEATEAATGHAATTADAEPAAADSVQTDTDKAQSPAVSGEGGAAAAAGDKKIPPGAVKLLSMTTVQEFQKKVAERKGRMSNH